MKRAILYARVSTDDQAERGYSIPTQLTATRQYAERLGLDVVCEYADDISGATPLNERPQGKKAADVLRAREAQAIVIYQVDRLGRDIVNLLVTVRDWLQRGIEIHFCDVGRITSELDIVFIIKSWQGADEREKIKERTSRGRRAKAEGGRVTGQGKAPYGYQYCIDVHAGKRVVTGLEIYEPEAAIVRRIYRLYAEEGVSMRQIAIMLTREHVPMPTERRNHLPTQGEWRIRQIARILESETYCGTWHYGKVIGKAGRGGKRAKDELVSVQVPKSIVTRQEWERARARKEYNARFCQRNARRVYLLSGLVRCPCGFALAGRTERLPSGRIVTYYRCGSHALRNHSSCRQPRSRTELLEGAAWQFMLDVFQDEREYIRRLEEAAAQQESDLEPLRAERALLIAQMADTKKSADRIALSVKQLGDGLVSDSLLHDAKQIERLYADQAKRLKELETELSNSGTLTKDKVERLIQYRRDIAEGLDNPTDELKRANYRDLELVVTRDFDKIVITSLVGGATYRAAVDNISIDGRIY